MRFRYAVLYSLGSGWFLSNLISPGTIFGSPLPCLQLPFGPNILLPGSCFLTTRVPLLSFLPHCMAALRHLAGWSCHFSFHCVQQVDSNWIYLWLVNESCFYLILGLKLQELNSQFHWGNIFHYLLYLDSFLLLDTFSRSSAPQKTNWLIPNWRPR